MKFFCIINIRVGVCPRESTAKCKIRTFHETIKNSHPRATGMEEASRSRDERKVKKENQLEIMIFKRKV